MVTPTTWSGPVLTGSKTRGTTNYVEMAQRIVVTSDDYPGSGAPVLTDMVIPANSTITDIRSFVAVVFDGAFDDVISVGIQSDGAYFVEFFDTDGVGFGSRGLTDTQAARWGNVGPEDVPIYIAFQYNPPPTMGQASIIITYLQAFNEAID